MTPKALKLLVLSNPNAPELEVLKNLPSSVEILATGN